VVKRWRGLVVRKKQQFKTKHASLLPRFVI
jgi:hypothetical protein